MIDRISFVPEAVRLASAALQKRSLPAHFERRHYTYDGGLKETVSIRCMFDAYPLVRIRAFRASDSEWWIGRTETNVPALLSGHNSSLPTSTEQVALALSRLRHIVGMVADRTTIHGLVPLGDAGRKNRATIAYAEFYHQFDDPGLRFLKASHVARLRNQQKPNLVCWGESTKMITRGLRVSVYDKLEKDGGLPSGDLTSAVRFELQFPNGQRLARDLSCALGLKPVEAGSVSTINPDGILALMGHINSRLLGFGWSPSAGDLSGQTKTTKLLALLMGKQLFFPHEVDRVLDNYREVFSPSPTTFQNVEKSLRQFAVAMRLENHPGASLPVQSFTPSPISDPWIEGCFARFMDSIGAPNVPDADILDAWGQTRILQCTPKDREQLGLVTPFAPPFPRKDLI
ncbi:MAG: hypothetical protein KDN05_03740 [Verrucomicrobiae bacterium]|nr:hypothetical protein [Verrucomicrobiae bacterium]